MGQQTNNGVDGFASLTPEEIAVLTEVQNGADVWGYYEAKMLRSVQKKAPDLIDICKAKNKPPGHQRQPYFGAVATRKGRAALARATGGAE